MKSSDHFHASCVALLLRYARTDATCLSVSSYSRVVWRGRVAHVSERLAHDQEYSSGLMFISRAVYQAAMQPGLEYYSESPTSQVEYQPSMQPGLEEYLKNILSRGHLKRRNMQKVLVLFSRILMHSLIKQHDHNNRVIGKIEEVRRLRWLSPCHQCMMCLMLTNVWGMQCTVCWPTSEVLVGWRQ